MITMHRALRHMAWANQQVFAACAQLPDAALDAHIVNPEWTAATILRHIVDGATWYVHCLGIAHWEEIPPPQGMADVPGLAAMLARFDAQILTSADLDDAELEFADEDGPRRVLRSTLLAQAVHHAAEHRAQLVDALESRGYQPINLDSVDLWSFQRAEG